MARVRRRGCLIRADWVARVSFGKKLEDRQWAYQSGETKKARTLGANCLKSEGAVFRNVQKAS